MSRRERDDTDDDDYSRLVMTFGGAALPMSGGSRGASLRGVTVDAGAARSDETGATTTTRSDCGRKRFVRKLGV
jgi:hypothetical protein